MSDHTGHQLRDLPLSVMAQSGLARVGFVAVALVGLWLAVAWAVSLP